MSFGKSYKLNDGNSIPAIGLGTWLSKPGQVKQAVIDAVKAGYRHIDEAKIYQNQHEVGAALDELFAEGVVKREDLFITSKLWNNAHKPHLVQKAYEDTCKELHVEYLDLYLIHWPVALEPVNDDISSFDNLMPPSKENKEFADLDTKTTLVDTWKAMVELKKSGKVKSIGVSNFTPSHIEGIIKATGFTPAVNQIEHHPLLPQEDLVRYSEYKGIHLTGYSPLGNSAMYLANSKEDPKKYELTTSEEVTSVAKKHNVDPAQVLIAWGIQRGLSIIPKSVTKSRIESNFQQIELSSEEFEQVTSRIKRAAIRFNVPWNYTPKWPINVFGEQIEVQNTTRHVNIGY